MSLSGEVILIPNVLAEGTQDRFLAPVIRDYIPKIKYYLAEDFRTARRFISSLKTGVVIEELKMELLNKDSAYQQVLDWMKKVPAEQPIGVLSEAGCPGVADPGALAVRAAYQCGRKVVPLPGPSSILLAIMASGLNGQSFAFNGYLPIDKAARKQAVQQLEKESAQKGRAQAFIETPFRNVALLEDLLTLLQGQTRLTVAADLTGPQEYVFTATVADWKKREKPELHKIPTVFVFEA